MVKAIVTLLLLLISTPAAAQDDALLAEAQGVLATERAFDTAAARDGQWAAFRAFAGPDAVLFMPQQVDAQTWLAGRADPPQTVRWQPQDVYIACDASLAVTTGAWQRPDGLFGYFTTVWQKQLDGSWKWVLDHGDALLVARPVPAQPNVHLPEDCDRDWSPLRSLFMVGRGGHVASLDHSLDVMWNVQDNGARSVRVKQGRFNMLLNDRVGPEAP